MACQELTVIAHTARAEFEGKRYFLINPLERRTRDRKVSGSSAAGSGGKIFLSRWFLFRYPFYPRVTAVERKTVPVIPPKVQVAGYSWAQVHPTYVAFHEMTL